MKVALAGNKRFGFYYGHVIVAAGFVASFLCWGTFRGYGLFVQPMTAQFGWSRGEMSLAYSLAFLLSGLLSVVAGKVVDRFGPKIMLITSGIVMGAGYVLMSGVTSLWQLYLFFGIIIGCGMSGSDNPMLATVARWFSANRGTVTGIVKAGAGVGIFVVPPLIGWIIVDNGWPRAWVVSGIIVAVGMVATGLALKWGPGKAEMPAAAAPNRKGNGKITVRHLSLREAMATRPFWIFAFIWFILVFVTQTVMLHIAPHAIDVGISAPVAATVVSVLGAASVLGRVGMGFLSDRMGTKAILLTSQSLLAAAFVWVMFVREPWMFYLFAVPYGIAHGAFYTLLSPMLAEMFGLRSLGAIIGALMFAGTVGGSIGPTLAGSLFDMSGSYQVDFIINLGLVLVSIVLVFLLRPVAQPEPVKE